MKKLPQFKKNDWLVRVWNHDYDVDFVRFVKPIRRKDEDGKLFEHKEFYRFSLNGDDPLVDDCNDIFAPSFINYYDYRMAQQFRKATAREIAKYTMLIKMFNP